MNCDLCGNTKQDHWIILKVNHIPYKNFVIVGSRELHLEPEMKKHSINMYEFLCIYYPGHQLVTNLLTNVTRL